MDHFIDHLPIATCVTDAHLAVIHWNHLLEQYTGVPSETAIGHPLSELLPYTATTHVQVRLKQVLNGGPPAVFSAGLHPYFIESNTRGGTHRTFETHAAAWQDEISSDRHLILTFTDQTEILGTLRRLNELRAQAQAELVLRTRAETRLRRSEEILFTLFQSIPSPTFIWRKQANTLQLDECNLAARKALKESSHPTLHAWLRALEGNHPFLEDRVRKSHASGKATQEERVTSAEEGTNIWHEFSFVPIPPDMVMVQVEDVTERKLAEENRNKADQLATANLMAATIAHEFNNPLAIIKTTVDLMAMTQPACEAGSKQFETIRRQVDRMKALSSRLLELQDLQEIDYAAGMRILDIHDRPSPGKPPSPQGTGAQDPAADSDR